MCSIHERGKRGGFREDKAYAWLGSLCFWQTVFVLSEQNYRCIGKDFPQLRCRFQTIHHGHHEVKNDQFRPVRSAISMASAPFSASPHDLKPSDKKAVASFFRI